MRGVMSRVPEQHSITAALAALEASPMSRKKAMLLVLLIDAAVDAARPDGADVLAHREAVARRSEALALVMELAAIREGGARLVVEAAEVTADEYPALGEARYMVSLYNEATVPRLVIVGAGAVRAALPVLRRAVAELAGT